MKTPEVLLLGNGLNNAFDGTTWNALIYKMARRKDLPKRIDLPYSLQILLATCGDYAQSLRDMQDALGLKVSQFVGLMGDTPQSETDALLGAQEARQHVERLVQRLLNQTA